MSFNDFVVSGKKNANDTLRVNHKAGKINGRLGLFKYRDKDTRQLVLYIPSLEITSYGADDKKALEMLKFSVNDYFDLLFSMPAKKRELELSNLGWKHSPLKNKEFSKAYVDLSGKLKNLNAVADEVEALTVEA